MSAAIRIAKVLVWFVYAWVTINVVLLLMAFFLLLLGANPTAAFAEWVYRSTQRSMAPFRGIFEPVVLSDRSVLDTSVLFAAIAYGVVAVALRGALDWLADWVVRVAQREYRSQRPPVSTPSPHTADGTPTTVLHDPTQPSVSAILVQRSSPSESS